MLLAAFLESLEQLVLAAAVERRQLTPRLRLGDLAHDAHALGDEPHDLFVGGGEGRAQLGEVGGSVAHQPIPRSSVAERTRSTASTNAAMRIEHP